MEPVLDYVTKVEVDYRQLGGFHGMFGKLPV